MGEIPKSEVPEQDCGLSGHGVNASMIGRGSSQSLVHNGAGSGGDAVGGFIAVPPPAIAAVGGKWGVALILCLIGFRCRGDRDVIVDGRVRWFRVSLARLSELSGAPVSQVRSALNAGVKAGVLESRKHRLGGAEDQCLSWRVLLDPAVWDVQRRNKRVAESDMGIDQRVAESDSGGVLDLARGRAESRKSLPLPEEVEEEREEGAGFDRARASREVVGSDSLPESNDDGTRASVAGASGAPAVRPADRCPEHIGVRWTHEPCGSCGDAKRAVKEWDAAKEERDLAAVAERRRRRQECADCRGDGWMLGDDGLPVEPVRKCHCRVAA